VVPRNDGKSIGKITKVISRPTPREVQGTIEEDSSNNCYVKDPANVATKIYIAGNEMNGAEKGDTVLLRVNSAWKKDAPVSAKVVKIVEKAPKEMVGVVKVDNNGNAWIFDPTNKAKPIYIPPEQLSSALNGDTVLVHLNPPRPDGNATGKILNIVKRAQQPKEITTRLKIDSRGHAWAIDANDKDHPICILETRLY
jgi:exoribonuclease R